MLPHESRRLQLQFLNAIFQPVFSTGTPICPAIEVALVDAHTGQVVSSGPGSSARVEIVVLEGDFGGDGGENWTLEEFKRNIARQREGKKPLLTGDHVILTLKDGEGLVGNVSFTDNSSWLRSGKFRLGARLMDNIDGFRVREARSEPFVVQNPKRDSCTKRYPPSLSNEVWRLEKIRKDGSYHKRLRENGVNTVQDFLILLNSDPTKLRSIIGTTMSAKDWGVTVQHARKCDLDKTILYSYNEPTSRQTKGVVFNVVSEVVGMLKDGQYVIADKLSEVEKAHARELVISAFGHRDKIVTLNDKMALNPPPSSMPSSSTNHQDLRSHNITRSNYSQQHDASPPDFMPIRGSSSFDSSPHNLNAMDISYEQPLSFHNQVRNTVISSENLNYSGTNSAIDTCIPRPTVRNKKAQRCWDVLLSVLRWRSSIKRIVATKVVWATLEEDDGDDVRAWMASLEE